MRTGGCNDRRHGDDGAARPDAVRRHQARIIATRKSHRDEVLVGINRDNPQLHDVYQLSLTSGELAKLIENPGYAGWIADEDMVVRGALSRCPTAGSTCWSGTAPTTTGARWSPSRPTTSAASDVLAFSGDGRSLLAISSIDTDTGRLVRVDLGTGEAEVLLEDPEADVAGAMLHPDTRDPQDRRGAQGPHRLPRARPVGRARLGGDPGAAPRRPQPVGRDEADNTWLIAFTDDAGPVQYYAYDRTSQAGSFLFSSRPELSRYDLARMEPFSSKPGRADRPRLRDLPTGIAGRRTVRPADRAERARRAAGAGRLGWDPRRSGWPTGVTCVSR